MKPSVPALWPGETFVCIATGPSLTADDVNACRGRARVIAVNDAVRLAQWADVLYACDDRWVSHYKGVPSFSGPKYSLTANTKKWPAWTKLHNDGVNGLCAEPTGLRTGRNSGYQAINLAVHLGATRILLLGYDMGRHGGKGHFFGEHPKNWPPSPYHSFLDAFKTIEQPLKDRGIEVVNCSRRTALKTFPQMSLDLALPPLPMEQAS